MKYWLLKSEPDAWSWENQVKEGASMWEGVRNYQARNNLKEMKKNDLCFFYHSVTERSIVGIVKVVKEYYPDPTDKTGSLSTKNISNFINKIALYLKIIIHLKKHSMVWIPECKIKK